MNEPSLYKSIAAVVAMAAVTGFTYNALSGSGLPLVRVAPVKMAVPDSAIFEPSPATGDTVSAGAFRVITLDQMKRAVDEGRGILYDARTPEEFAKGHIPGATNLYAMAPEAWVEKIAEVPRDTLLVIYCSNPHCPFAKTLAEFLGSFGFSNMLLFDEGWDAWAGAGLPSAKEGG